MLGIIVEKPSARKNFEKALGGNPGTFNGEKYIIRNSLGHVYQLTKDMSKQVTPELADKYSSWNLNSLPWHAEDLKWKMEPVKGTEKTIKDLADTLSKCDEIVIATDNDPSGEGELIAWEIIFHKKLKAKKYSRMYFEDESPKSIQKAFKERKTLGSNLNCMYSDPDYRKATFRMHWDYISMQWTRVASLTSGNHAVLRNGRLKSAMMVIVGDQLEAVKNYKKTVYYEQAFKDENGVVYLEKNGKRYAKKDEVPKIAKGSAVVKDSTTRKKQGPPAYLDLATLSAMLAAKGIPAQTTLDTYQRMYEDSVVSYPRTEDKCITLEQFNELDRCIEQIADLVGVNRSMLTHRKNPRKTHIKTGMAHGANRPGSNVPISLSTLDDKYGRGAREIYETLARCYLATLCDDYEYDHQEGHLKEYPTFFGSSNVPAKQGWRSVYTVDDKDDEEEEGTSGLGTFADPFIKEGFNKKPAAPTMKWLMKQLEKREVGTGATRTKTYADITNQKDKYPLMSEKRGKISFTDLGEENYKIIKGTHIADLTITEQVVKQMEEVANGADSKQFLDQIEKLIVEDIKKMSENRPERNNYSNSDGVDSYGRRHGYCESLERDVAFKITWGGHEFTEEEQEALLRGETITFTVKKGSERKTYAGKLEEQEYNGQAYVGFKADFNNAATKTETDLRCPLCKRAMRKFDWGYGCTGYKDGCGFAVGYKFRNARLSDAQVRELLKKGKLSKPIVLMSAAGNEYKLLLRLAPGEKYPVQGDLVRDDNRKR